MRNKIQKFILQQELLTVILNPPKPAPVVPYTQQVLTLFGSNVLAYYPFNETEGPLLLDVSGNERHGNYYGVDLASILGPKGTDMAPYYDGANDTTNVGSSIIPVFSEAAGTLSLWIKPYSADFWADGINYCAVEAIDWMGHYVEVSKVSNNQMRLGAFGFYVYADSASPTDWQHYAMTWDATEDLVTHYCNGESVGSGAFQYTFNAADIQFGTVAGSWLFHGYLAHALFLDRAATPDEIAIIGK